MMYTVKRLDQHHARLISIRPEQNPRRQADRLAIATADATYIVKHHEILYCQAEGNYCTIVRTDGSKLLVSKTLKAVCQALADDSFIRTHQSFLVHRNYVREVRTDAVVLDGQIVVPVSRSRRGEVFQVITQSCTQL
jgi:two-component system LytT family response regulator